MRKPSRRVAALGGIGAAAAVALSAGLAVAGTSAQVTYTTAGTAAAAGWSVRSANVDFTHTQGRFGSAGNSSWENLPVGTQAEQASLLALQAGDPIPVSGGMITGAGVLGGIGAELCDTSQNAPGYAAQEGIVQVAPGQFDVIESVGYFGPHALNSNGLLGVALGSKALTVKVLLTGVHANDTVDLNVLYNARTNYRVTREDGRGLQVTRGHITFTAQDLVSGGIGFDTSIAGAFIAPNFVTNEAAQGVVSDTAHAIPLTGVAVPAPNGGVLTHTAPSELIRVAHSAVAGNSVAVGGHEVQGSFFTNSAWNATPVASTADGTPGGALYLDPSLVAADNFYVAGGIGLVG